MPCSSPFASQLPEPLTGKQISLEEAANGAPALLVMFICNHCPFVKILKEGIVSLTNEYQGKGLASVAISANSIKTHPQDGPEHMANDAKSFGRILPRHMYVSVQWEGCCQLE